MRFLLPLLALLGLLVGCEEAQTVDSTADQVEQALLEGPVTVKQAGWFARVLGCSGICVQEYRFWVDIAVRNDGFRKQVGILWSADGWRTIRTSLAQYEAPLEGNYEQWGVDVNIGTYTYDRPTEIEYAVFATIEGTTHWDPRNNYYVFDSVNAERPVRRLRSEVHYEANHGAVMTGRVRVYDLAFEKQVTIRYTTDGWATSHDVDADWEEGQDWTFRIENLGRAPLPEAVEYAVRYQVRGEEFWDSNNGGNYRHTLAPQFQGAWSWVDASRPVSGILNVVGDFVTDLPNEGIEVRVDNGPWTANRYFTFSTSDLADGPHRVTYRLRVEGGYEALGEIPFTVDNRFVPTGLWQPPQLTMAGQPVVEPNRTSSIWALASDDSDRLYVVRDDFADDWNARVVRYSAYNQNANPVIFDALPDNRRPNRLAVDAQGRVYATVSWNEGALCRLTAQGHLDATFGQAGCLSLGQPIAGAAFCNAGDVAVSDHHVYVLDTCGERRVVRFDLTGREAGAVNVAGDDDSGPSALYHDGGSLWVLQSRTLLRLSDSARTALRVDARTPLQEGFEFNSAMGLTRGLDGRFFAVNGYGNGSLVAFDEDGLVEGIWFSDSSPQNYPGTFDLPQGVVTLSDGSLVVAGAEGGHLTRFSGQLQ